AALYTSNPQADFFDFVCPPFGKDLVPNNPIFPLIAVPTTAGTGSETTGAAVMDLPKYECKSVRLSVQKTLKGFKLLVLISSTGEFLSPLALTSSSSTRILTALLCSNPLSDIWSLEALKMMRKYFRRSVNGSSDDEAKYHMLLASTFVGIGFGNAGVHLCHGLRYPITLKASYYNADYPPVKALIPHGLSVITTAAAGFDYLTPAFPERYAEAAPQLGAKIPVCLSPNISSLLRCCLFILIKTFA
uniref:Fe-ADH domain-containing protein n=1 Tax=Angiostrongylus cantonensis TaxID=6313 RepID=A0A0K0CVY3_ANGCA